MDKRTKLIAEVAARFLVGVDGAGQSRYTAEQAIRRAADVVERAEAHVASENAAKKERAIVCGGTPGVRDLDGYNWSSL